jgi:hypothetical protein
MAEGQAEVTQDAAQLLSPRPSIRAWTAAGSRSGGEGVNLPD